MDTQTVPLRDAFAKVPDFRQPQGRRYNLLPLGTGNGAQSSHLTTVAATRDQHCRSVAPQPAFTAERKTIDLFGAQNVAADGSLGIAHCGGDQIGPDPTDRAKSGSKKSLLVDGQGGPLSLLIAPAKVNDYLLLAETLDTLDGGYNNGPSRGVVAERGYRTHIRPSGVEVVAAQERKHWSRRWVVERTFAWLSKCRGSVIRYEVRSENYFALLQLACALLWYRRLPPAGTS